jgi:hypothetical protein
VLDTFRMRWADWLSLAGAMMVAVAVSLAPAVVP